MSLIFHLRKNDGGFFCQIWKLVSNYLYAKKHNLKFYIDDSQWMFKHTLGWKDYFASLDILSEQTVISQPVYNELDDENIHLHQFTLNDYISIFKEVFILNDSVRTLYDKYRTQLFSNYNSIMIRRGDKMYGEANYIETKEYVKKLIEKSKLDIFVQTDDYRAYEEVYEYIKSQNLNINVKTSCPNNKRGAFVFNYQPDIGSSLSDLNNNYLLNLAANVQQKTVNSYSSNEMKEHVEEMLIGLQICMHSNYLVTDLQSNVTRFLLCTHLNPINVLSVGNIQVPLFNIALECPAKGFIPYM